MNIEVSLEDARQMLELYRTCELADMHFKSCQSDLFRRHVSASCKAESVRAAFGRLKETMDRSENPNSSGLEE